MLSSYGKDLDLSLIPSKVSPEASEDISEETSPDMDASPHIFKQQQGRYFLLVKILFSWLFLCLFLFILLAFSILQLSDYFISDLPHPSSLSDPRENTTILIQSSDGQEIGKRGAYYGGKVNIEDISPHLIHAVIALEDRNFFTHTGFDPIGIMRAMLKNMRSGRVVQGASTITQQLAKDIFVGPERSYVRKVKELLYALKIESTYSKEHIIQLYLNRVYLGAGLYGIAAAAERYFDCKPSELTVAQSALIAGMLKAPSRYSPIYNLAKSHNRAKVALNAMFLEGYITKDQQINATLFPAHIRSAPFDGGFGYVADRISELVPKLLTKLPKDVIVTTTINTDLQSTANALTYDFVQNIGKQKDFEQAAFIALDDNGAILAMAGGTSYGETAFNRTTHALRQPGSAFKPFVYAAAFERGYKPSTILMDEDVSFGKYRPQNYKKKYAGAVSLRTAFAQSINTVAVKLAHRTGIRNILSLAEKSGIIAPLKPYLSLALGAFEVTPLELTAAYIPFFNGGYVRSAHLITQIKNKQGEILFSKEEFEPEKIYSDQTLYSMKDIFNAVTAYGTGTRAKINDVPVYGKTGTTSGYKDAWFIGHAGNKEGITAAVWVGNDNFRKTNKATGGGTAAILWHNILKNHFKSEPRPIEHGLGIAPVRPAIADSQDAVTNILQQLKKDREAKNMDSATINIPPKGLVRDTPIQNPTNIEPVKIVPLKIKKPVKKISAPSPALKKEIKYDDRRIEDILLNLKKKK